MRGLIFLYVDGLYLALVIVYPEALEREKHVRFVFVTVAVHAAKIR